MMETKVLDISIDEIINRIKEECQKNKKPQISSETQRSEERSLAQPISVEDRAPKKHFDSFLWRYGNKYAKTIKKIPLINSIALQHHSRLAQKHLFPNGPSNPSRSLPSSSKQIETLSLKEIPPRTLRTKRALFQELANQMTENKEKDSIIRELLNQRIIRLKDELTERSNMIENLNNRLSSFEHQMDHLLRQSVERDQVLEGMNHTVRKIKEELSNLMGPEVDEHLLDAVYVAFEDKFRGAREEIKEKLRIYIPMIEQSKAGAEDAPILDLGCGRGEWLELMREYGFTAKGIDTNRLKIQKYRGMGLDAIESDVISYLKNQESNSVGAITGFHLLEHLPLKTLITLLDESHRILQSGGIIIFEAPNPTNIFVSTYDFYRDPSHLNHLHPDTINFLAEVRGFVKTGAYFIDRENANGSLIRSTEWKLNSLDDYLRVSRDFVLIGYKA